MKRALATLIALAVLGTPLAAFAQSPAAGSRLVGAAAAPEAAALTLTDAILLARDNSLASKMSRQRLEATAAQRGVTVSGALPSIGLSTSANYNQLPAGGFASLLGGSGGGLVGFPAQGVTVDTTLSANQVIFDAFATTDAIAIADKQILQSRHALAAAEQDAMLNAAIAYFQVLRAEGVAEVAANTVKQNQGHLRLGELRLKAGTDTRATVLQLRAQLANAQGQLTQARNAVSVARLNLANALNAPVADRALATPRVPTLQVTLGQTELLASLERRPEIQQARLATEIGERQITLESRALWPNLQATSRYSQRGLNQGQFLAGVTANWNVFDGFRVRNRMEAARNQAEEAKVQLEQARQNTAVEIRTQYQTRDEAASRVATAREGLASAQEAYRLGLRRFEVGLATPFEVTDVQATLVASQDNYVQAINDLRVAEIRLARALGHDIAAYLTTAP